MAMEILLINSTHEKLPFDHDKGSVAYFSCGLKIIKNIFPEAVLSSTILFPREMANQFKINSIYNRKPSNRVFSLSSVFSSYMDLIIAYIMNIFSKYFNTRWFISSKNPLLKLRKKLLAYCDSDLILHMGLDHYSDNGGGNTVCEHSKEILLASLLNKPIALFSQSPGPFEKGLSSIFAKKVLFKANIILAREPVSFALLKGMGLENNVKMTADPAFILDPISSKRSLEIIEKEIGKIREDGVCGCVGFVISGYNTSSIFSKKSNLFYFIQYIYSALLFVLPETLVNPYIRISKGIFAASDFKKSSSCMREIVQIIDYMTEVLNLEVILIAHARGGNMIDDITDLEKYQTSAKNPSRVKLIRNDYGPDEIKGIISHLDLLISTKMHACIAGLSMGIPTIAIAWSHKYFGIMDSFGLDEYVSNSLDPELVIPRIQSAWNNRDGIRNRLLERILEIKRQSNMAGYLINDLVNK